VGVTRKPAGEGADGATAPGGEPTVVYITGSGRSGSTLLERALGSAPGLVNVGELFDIFRRDAAQTERCGCGEPFATCPFWAEVARRAFGDWDSERSVAIQRLANDAVRARAASLASACDMALKTIALPLAGSWHGRLRFPK